MSVVIRDTYAFLPLLLHYMEKFRSLWVSEMSQPAFELFSLVCEIFNSWSKSQMLRREEMNFVTGNNINPLPFISTEYTSPSIEAVEPLSHEDSRRISRKSRRERKKKSDLFTPSMSLIMVGCKRMLPVGMAHIHSYLQEIIQQAKHKLLQIAPDDMFFDQKSADEEVMAYIKQSMESVACEGNSEEIVGKMTETKMLEIAKVTQRLHFVDHPPMEDEVTHTHLLSRARRRAVMECFKMAPLYSMPRHNAINMFLNAYREKWLEAEQQDKKVIIQSLTEMAADSDGSVKDPLTQLVMAFSRAAQVQDEDSTGPDEFLYKSYAEVMGNSCTCEEDDDDGEGGGAEPSFEEQEMAKQQLLSEQSRLMERGCAEMILLMISRCRGEQSEVAEVTLKLGISMLTGGNIDVQTGMLNYLLEKKDVSFFMSISGLMQSCSVLNLDSFERCNKAEDQGASGGSDRVMPDASFSTTLFRFLQLLCEGHNGQWQDYLRIQAGNMTSVNLITTSVDYIVRLQESMSDFYWHYSSRESIDNRGREAFMTAILVGKQVFASLTEMIQGPCTGNQLALTHSRLWDAVSGFFHIFANLQQKLSQDPEQMEFLRELMDLQKEMVTLLLSMLEGNVLNGPIGKQMVDTLALCSDNVEQVLTFFTTFLKYSEIVSGTSFKDYDINGDGVLQPNEFRLVLESQKVYGPDQIEFLIECADKDHDGKISYKEFSERFSDPASEIGFNIALLFTNLSEHTTNDPRLEKLVETAADLIDIFEDQLGRIEILGGTKRIERVYFEISEENKSSWEAETIKESKREFLFSGVVGMPDTEKLATFVDFCEDTIYEMQHTRSLEPEGSEDETPSEPWLPWFKALFLALFWKMMTPVGFLTVLLRLALFCFIKIPLYLLKIPYIIFLKMPLKIAYTITKSVMSASWELTKAALSQAPESDTLQDTTQIDPQKSSPLPDLITDEADNMLHRSVSAATGPSDGQPHVLDVVMNVSRDQEDDSAMSRKAPVFLRLYKNWLEVRSNVVQFVYSPLAKNDEKQEDSESSGPSKSYAERFMCLLARNYFKIKTFGAILSFFINIVLLFCKISVYMPEGEGQETCGMTETDEGVSCEEWAGEGIEVVTMDDDVLFLEPVLAVLSLLHVFVALLILLAYYKLKVPLVVFQREKEVSRKLEFDGLYLQEKPEWNDLRARWDSIVISSKSFPVNFWDKFVKKRAKGKYAESVGEEEIDQILGMAAQPDEATQSTSSALLSTVFGDFRYNLWKFGVIFSDQAFLYIFFYFVFSIAGNFSRFFFAIHLMDIAFGNKDLSAILQSVTHNGKQLVLTAMLTSIVIYLYTVVAFNFFRPFYAEEGEEGDDSQPGGEEDEQKCDNMWQCFIFHLHHGLRAGGGIGDEIEDPDGDPSMYYRIIFDLTFFFFVIVILLAIIQGLIIDAFGELRGQLEQTKEDLENKCFICGLGKDWLDEQAPHGFEIHTEKEHNFANYMFFLMYLINKDETEYTGQETYVWNLYQQRNFDFFPVGDCFRKQYEEELKQ